MEEQRERQSRKRGKSEGKSLLPFFLIFFCFILLFTGAGLFYYVKKYMPTKARADLNSYFSVSGDNVELYLNHEKQVEDSVLTLGRMQDGEVYLPYGFVVKQLNIRFYYDDDEKTLRYALPDSVEIYQPGEKGKDGKLPYFVDGKNIFLSLSLIQSHTALEVENFTDTEHKRVFLYNAFGKEKQATLTAKEAVRVQGGVKSPILTDMEKGDKVLVLEKMEKWSKVETKDGFIGYLRNSRLGDEVEIEKSSDFRAPVYSHKSMGEGVHPTLAFHQITTREANNTLDTLLPNAAEANIVAPTWYVLSDNAGNFISYSDANYVAKAHAAGKKVFATLNNFDAGKVDAKALFSAAKHRSALIENLVKDLKEKQVDGINVDIELLPESAARDYLEFMRELSIACRTEELFLSVDCYVPYSYNAYYNIKELGEICDYVVIMCYDEHYAGSEEAGSVSSLSYVERGIDESAAKMDKNRVIIALPFYTRVWITDANGKLRSEALSITKAKEWITEKNVPLEWKEDIGQYYGVIQDGNEKKEIWMEDEKSMEAKMSLLREKGIQGVAAWKLGQEPEGFWSILNLAEKAS
ncbi:glycosyl hydrolase family 18 protein [Oribacterium sinus]|uniref:glycosyl hydrolase family 18 protein n=1 Tax=Oribacterium sinus TaxID=237576 RepID=UPI0028EF3160|nr:glycosyl hydrolase family 18 protein [Oribacterium sinus]